MQNPLKELLYIGFFSRKGGDADITGKKYKYESFRYSYMTYLNFKNMI